MSGYFFYRRFLTDDKSMLEPNWAEKGHLYNCRKQFTVNIYGLNDQLNRKVVMAVLIFQVRFHAANFLLFLEMILMSK